MENLLMNENIFVIRVMGEKPKYVCYDDNRTYHYLGDFSSARRFTSVEEAEDVYRGIFPSLKVYYEDELSLRDVMICQVIFKGVKSLA